MSVSNESDDHDLFDDGSLGPRDADLPDGSTGDADPDEATPSWLAAYRDEYLVDVGSHSASPDGIVYLVGAGPGDPGLLTVRARALLDVCDAVVHDGREHPSMLVRSDPSLPAAEVHFVGNRDDDTRSVSQQEVNDLLVRLAREGRRVVRLTEGDPWIFGSGGEEALALSEADVAFEVVPGVTSGVASATHAGIPVTHRGISSAVTIATAGAATAGESSPTSWSALAQAGGTIVLHTSAKEFPRVAADLVAGGLPGEIPAAAVQDGTGPDQRTVVATLETLASAMRNGGVTAPSVIVIGWTVVLRDELAWFDRRPLHGRRVLVAEPARGSALARRLRELGAQVLGLPPSTLEHLDPTPVQEAMQWLEQYDWIIFGSRQAVDVFWHELRASGRDARALGAARLVAVGATGPAALLAHGLAVDLTAERPDAEAVLEALSGRDDLPNSRVLYLAGQDTSDLLLDGLEQSGAMVEVMALYRAVPDMDAALSVRDALTRGEVDIITVTSASEVGALMEAVGPVLAASVPTVALDAQSGETARESGLDVRVEAREATLAALVEAVNDVAITLESPFQAPADDRA